MKKRTLLLNISLILGLAYHLLFIAGYLLQKPIFGGAILKYPAEVMEQIKPVYLVPVIIVTAVFGAGLAAFALCMKRNTSKQLFTAAALFSGAAFIVERLTNVFVYNIDVLDGFSAAKGQTGVLEFGLSQTAIRFMDIFLLPLFVAAIVLMCCAGCVKEETAVMSDNA